MAIRSLGRFLIALLLTLGADAGIGATAAGGSGDRRDDPLHAPDCQSALAALQAQEVAADAAAAASAASGVHGAVTPGIELQAARRNAARSCLASRADRPAPAARSIQPPVVVAPVTALRPPAPTGVAVPPPPPAPAAAERPYAVTACDPGGCWANDGSRLNRVGPNLWGKRGICTLHGTLLQCP